MKNLQLLAVVVIVFGSGLAHAAPKTEISVGVNASIWDSAVALDIPNGIFPVRGSGQLNGEFTIAARDGIEIGLRATDRVDGLLTAAGTKKGTYAASTGFDTGTTNRAEWNYDIHVDLQGTGTTLGEYGLTLSQTFISKLSGSAGPFDLTFPDIFPGLLDGAVLYQLSFNPLFFNDTFDVDREGTYNLMVKLQPKGGGSPLIAHIKVVVSD